MSELKISELSNRLTSSQNCGTKPSTHQKLKIPPDYHNLGTIHIAEQKLNPNPLSNYNIHNVGAQNFGTKQSSPPQFLRKWPNSKAHVPVAVAEQLTTTARLLVVVMAPFALKVARNCSEWQQLICHIPLLSPLTPMLPLLVALRSTHCAAVATMALFTQHDDIDVASAAIASNSLTLTLLQTRWFLNKKQRRSMLWWVLNRWLSFKGKGKRRKGWAGALSKRPRKGLPPL